MPDVCYADILWGVDAVDIENLRNFIEWDQIYLRKYFLIRMNAGKLELRLATLRSCGKKDSMLLNHKHLGITETMLKKAYETGKKTKGCYRGDYGIDNEIQAALKAACEKELL